jgi:WD40 repeat protein
VTFSPRHSTQFGSVSEGGSLLVWSTSESGFIFRIRLGEELLTLDYAKYEDAIVAVGSKSGRVSIWDLRHSRTPLAAFQASQPAHAPVRKVLYYPFQAAEVVIGSYDRSVRRWNVLTTQCLFSSHPRLRADSCPILNFCRV